MTQLGLVVLAGGSGSRLGADRNKVYLEVQGREILAHSLIAAASAERVARIVIVARAGEIDHALRLSKATAAGHDVQVVTGGSTRCESERNGVEALRAATDAGDINVIAVHDGARPYVSPLLIDTVASRAAEVGGAVPGLPVEGLLYSLDEMQLVDRAKFSAMQTPQAFDARTLVDAHAAAAAAGFEGMDTAEVVEKFSSARTAVVAGDPGNTKVTFRRDLGTSSALGLSPEGLLTELAISPASARNTTVAVVTVPAATPVGLPLINQRNLRETEATLPAGRSHVLLTRAGEDERVDQLLASVPHVDETVLVSTRACTNALKEVENGRVVRSVDRSRYRKADLPMLMTRETLRLHLRDESDRFDPAAVATAARHHAMLTAQPE